MNNRRPDKRLACSVKSGMLVVEIGVNTLAHAIINSSLFWELMGPEQECPSSRFSVSHNAEFAKEVAKELMDELGEDGSTLLTNMIDQAAERILENGSEWLNDKASGQ